MKNITIKAIAVTSLVLLCGCDREQMELPIPDVKEEVIPVQFTIDLRKEILPFPGTKSIPPLDIPEPTPARPASEGEATPDPEELYNRIDYIVYDDEQPDTPLKRKQFTPQDADFTIVYDSLPAGNYHICFLAHQDPNIVIDGRTATFDNVYDTFHLYHPIAIQAGEQIIEDITLRRIVSKIEFVASDAVSAEAKQFTINVDGYPNQIDLSTGEGTAVHIPYQQTYLFKSEDVGKSGLSHAFFTFVPVSSATLSARLTTLDQQDEIRREREVPDIQPLANYIIRYTGILYTPKTSDDTFTLDIVNDGAWEETIDKEIEE